MEFFKRSIEDNGQQEKTKKLAAARQRVEHIMDKLGMGIDQEIKETIAILLAMDFETSSSCAGHKDRNEGYALPYVEFYTPAPDGWKEDDRKQAAWKETNLKQRERLQPLLTKFYTNRKVDPEYKLMPSPMGIFGGFRLQNTPVSAPIDDEKDAVKMISACQREMADFTKFLKDKFLQER